MYVQRFKRLLQLSSVNKQVIKYKSQNGSKFKSSVQSGISFHCNRYLKTWQTTNITREKSKSAIKNKDTSTLYNEYHNIHFSSQITITYRSLKKFNRSLYLSRISEKCIWQFKRPNRNFQMVFEHFSQVVMTAIDESVMPRAEEPL